MAQRPPPYDDNDGPCPAAAAREGSTMFPVEEAPHGPLASPGSVALIYLGAESICVAMQSNANQNEQGGRQTIKDALNAM
jgi:hypothetical protein